MSEKLTQAQEFFKNKKFRTALDLFMQEIADHPENPDAYFGAGQCLFMLKRPSEVVGIADRIIDLDPASGMSHVLKAEVHGLLSKEIQKSRDEIERAYSLEPTNPKVLYSYGHLLLHFGNWDEGINFLKMALEQNPKMLWAYYNLGLAYLKKGNVTEALYYAGKVYELRPTFKNRIRLIYAHLESNRLLKPIILCIIIVVLVSAMLHEYVLFGVTGSILLLLVYLRVIFQTP